MLIKVMMLTEGLYKFNQNINFHVSILYYIVKELFIWIGNLDGTVKKSKVYSYYWDRYFIIPILSYLN